MVPSSGITAPHSALIMVDLPAPLSPITASTSPRRRSKSAPSIAVTWPYRLTRPSARSTASCSAAGGVAAGSVCVVIARLRAQSAPRSLALAAMLPRCRLRAWSPCPPSSQLVQRHRGDHQETGGHVLVQLVDAGLGEAAAQHTHDQ